MLATSPSRHLQHPDYRPDIDGLRAVAVLAVVAFHAFPGWAAGGFIGVDIFFVISGFLISTIIFESLEKGTFSFAAFYARRIRRIFPALILVLAACSVFGWLVLLTGELNQLGRHIAAGAGFASNFVLWNEAGYFDTSVSTKPLLHLWSLGIEEQFYILWPFAVWLAWKKKCSLLLLTISACGISFLINILGANQDLAGAFYLPHMRFWELLSGSILAWLMLQKKHFFVGVREQNVVGFCPPFIQKTLVIDRASLLNVCSFVGCALVAYGFWEIDKTMKFPGTLALLPVFGASLIILAGSGAWINRNILSSKIAVWLGLISFPLYLWHWPLLSFARILENGVPSRTARMAIILISIALAWVTTKFIEKPIRFGKQPIGAAVTILCALAFIVFAIGLILSRTDPAHQRTFEDLAIKRKGHEYAIGNSFTWYQGKSDWLFLGNAYANEVAKLKLGIVPTDDRLENTRRTLTEIAHVGNRYGTRVVLFIGPNKSTIYPEYLPEKLVPSKKRYISFFIASLSGIPNLTVYDPTHDLLRLKASEGFLYWKTDTHWNSKGSFFAYSGFSNTLGFPVPAVSFTQGSTHVGDLMMISGLKNFPLDSEDSWDVVWKGSPRWTEVDSGDGQRTSFGTPTIVINKDPLLDKYVWVVGDSFANGLKPYFNATFSQVRYVGHWENTLKDLARKLEFAKRKPDVVVIVRVERSF